jgi:hypothetical protein
VAHEVDDLSPTIRALLDDSAFLAVSPYSLERVLFVLDRLYWKARREQIPPHFHLLPYIHFLIDEGYQATFIVPEARRASVDPYERNTDLEALRRLWRKYLAQYNRTSYAVGTLGNFAGRILRTYGDENLAQCPNCVTRKSVGYRR